VVADIEMLSVVALLEDLPEVGLVRGQVGAVVENRGSRRLRGRVPR
jgi:uncharacterized protein DUF4926